MDQTYAVRPLRRRLIDPATLPLDPDKFRQIVDDLRANADHHAPAPVWEEAGGGASSTADRYPAANLLQPWLGFGAQPVTPEVLGWYYPYLKVIDRFGLVDHYFADAQTIRPEGAGLIVADLGSIIDVNLATAHLDTSKPFSVVEIGGGYGRLAEAFFSLFPGKVRWVLVDAVPSSMIYAREYLSRACPEIRVGSYYDGDAQADSDCFIVPSWRLDLLAGLTFDLGVNVQSMQEMDQHHVDGYLAWLDGALKPDGLAYLVNRRDHVFRGAWNYPAHWQALTKAPTPRSFLRDMPAEVFRKTDADQAKVNREVEAAYQQGFSDHRAAAVARAELTGLRAY